MGNSERLKGARAERELSALFREYGFDTHRGFTFHHESDVVGLPHIHVECKFVEKLNVRAAHKQAIEEARKRVDGEPVVFWKKSREPWLAVMDLKWFLKIYREYLELKEEKDESLRING